MKKILFVLPHMLCGGVEKALLALVHELPKQEYDISINVVKSEGEFVSLVPKDIHYAELPLDQKIRDGLMLGGIKASLRHYAKTCDIPDFCKTAIKVIKRDPFATLLCDFDKIDELPETYDIAVCFHIHMPFLVRYVAEKVKAKKKIAWIHNDFKMSGYNVRPLKYYLDKYDRYFVVSEQLRDEFVQIFPDCKDKTTVAHNIVSEGYISECLTDTPVKEYATDRLNILTIGRLDKQKGYDLAIEACKILKDKKLKFRWFVLGSGSEKDNIVKWIAENKVEDYFCLLGTRVNPYPYIDRCDIYVQPSKHEGYGIAVAEARMLNKPIVCTDFTGARDQIQNGYTGTIVDVNSKAVADAISELIDSPEKRDEFSYNLSKSEKQSKNEIAKILNYL